MMDDGDSVYTDSASIIGSPASFRTLPSNRTPLHTDDFTNKSSQAVLNALKALQQKITKLELEREQAEQNFESLEKEKEKCRDLLTQAAQPVTQGTTTGPVASTQSTVTPAVRPISPANPACEADKENLVPTSTSTPACPVTKTLYYPSTSKPYTTYIRAPVKEVEEPPRDSRIGVLEKQLEYMRRMVHQAELERSKAAEKVTTIEREREKQEKNSTLEEMRTQARKIGELERECSKLVTAHCLAEGKIKDLEDKLEEETQCHLKQSGELERLSAENRQLMLNLTPPPPSSPPPPSPPSTPLQKDKLPCKKKRKRGVSASSAVPCSVDWKSMPFVAGQSSSPSHSLSANVQQMLSVLKQENPTLCARITTQKKEKAGMSTRDIKQVISGLEDDLGTLTIEYQALKKGGNKDKLESVASNMKRKSQHINKLKSHLNKLKKDQSSKQTVVKARPSHTATAAKEYEISVRGSNTKELLSKVKAIKEVLSSRDLQWV